MWTWKEFDCGLSQCTYTQLQKQFTEGHRTKHTNQKNNKQQRYTKMDKYKLRIIIYKQVDEIVMS